MSIAAFTLSAAPIAQGQIAATKTKVPPKRQTIAVASTTLVPEPR